LAIGYLPTLNSKESSASAGYQWKSSEKKRHLPPNGGFLSSSLLQSKGNPAQPLFREIKTLPIVLLG